MPTDQHWPFNIKEQKPHNNSLKLIHPCSPWFIKEISAFSFLRWNVAKHWIEIDTEEMVMMAIWTMSDHFSMRSKSKGFEVHMYLSQNITKLRIAQLAWHHNPRVKWIVKNKFCFKSTHNSWKCMNLDNKVENIIFVCMCLSKT